MYGSSCQFSNVGFVQVKHGEQVGKACSKPYMFISTKVPKGIWNLLNLLKSWKLKEIDHQTM
jgi:hypothetical protein